MRADAAAQPRGGQVSFTGEPLPAVAAAYRWSALVIVALGLALRAWHLDRLGISHWDAGTYSAGPLGVGPYGRADHPTFYAPPLVPEVFRLLFSMFGAIDTIAIGAVALCGVATVAVVWAAGRAWVGSTAALVGAAALAAMEYHVLFSRQALTDVPFTLFFVLFAWSFTRAVERGSKRDFVFAGLAAGAATWTKYHGFFTLVLGVLYLLASVSLRRLDGTTLRRALRGGALTLAVGGLAIVALAFEVERRIGLAALRTDKAGWLAGLEPWIFPKTGLFIARCLASWISPFVLVPAVVGYAVMLVRRTRGDLLLLCWSALFLGALPFYTNYPRLLFPLLVPIALAAGVGLDACARFLLSRARTGDRGTLPASAALVLVTTVFVPGVVAARDALAIEDRGYAHAAQFLREQPIAPEPDLLITQHAILFYLHGSEQRIVTYDEKGALDLLRSGRFRYVVADLRLAKPQTEAFRAAIDALGDRLELVRTIPNPLPETVIVNSAGFEWFDRLHSGAADAEEMRAYDFIRIWRLVKAQ